VEEPSELRGSVVEALREDCLEGISNMSIFTDNELDYLRKQRLGRLATVDADGNPHVVPVGFRYNSETDTIDIGGHDVIQSKKWRDAGRHPRVAFVIDDVLPPWQPRSITIQADAELLEHGGERFGQGFAPQIMRLHPVKIIAWGIDAQRQSRTVKNKLYS
jgi:pyridoxamine 5'-phosphate oxidase family protein